MAELLIPLALVAALVFLTLLIFAVLLPLLDRGIRVMLRERRRSGASGGVAGIITEFDRIVRPSVEHVVEVKDEARRPQDDVSGD